MRIARIGHCPELEQLERPPVPPRPSLTKQHRQTKSPGDEHRNHRHWQECHRQQQRCDNQIESPLHVTGRSGQDRGSQGLHLANVLGEELPIARK